MEQYDVIIIGGGINGLTLGAYLVKAGAKVLICERRWETGGAVMTDEQSGCRLNTHATYMMMMDVMPAYKDLELEEYGCTYLTPQPAMAFLTREGKALCLYGDPEKSGQSIARFSQQDKETFIRVYNEFKALTDEILVPQTYRPALPALEVVHLLGSKPLGQKLLDLSEKTPREIIEGCGFKSELLKAALLYMTTMWGIDPEVSGVGYLVPLYIVRMLNSALIRGGSHRLSSAIYKGFIGHKGEVEDTAEVAEIIIEGKQAVGIRTAAGAEYRGKCIVSTVDPEQTFLRFIGESQLNGLVPGLVESVKGWEWETVSHYLLHLVLKEEPIYKAGEDDPEADRALIQVMGVETVDDLIKGFHLLKQGDLASFGHTTIATKFDSSQTSSVRLKKSTLPIEWLGPLFMHVLRFETLAPYEAKDGKWDTLKETYAEEVLDMLKAYAPNLAGANFIRQYAYPPTYIEDKFSSMKKGSIKHGEYSSMQMGYFRPNDLCSRYRTPVKNLYVCGASTYPGGMVLLGAPYITAGIIAEDIGLQPWWELPDYIQQAIGKGFAL